jgi:hypothetical protein
LVPSQVLHFFGLKPCKNAFYKEVVQKLKFQYNAIILLSPLHKSRNNVYGDIIQAVGKSYTMN